MGTRTPKPVSDNPTYTIEGHEFRMLEKAAEQLCGLFSMANELDGNGYAAIAPFLDSIGDDISFVVDKAKNGGGE